MLHPSVPDLERYYMGRSSPEESARVRAHLDVCESCAEYLRETHIILEVLRRFACPGMLDEPSTDRAAAPSLGAR
jgi:hypothetical protein